MKTLDDLLKGKQIIAVVCNQYGDTGKGKFSDYFAATWADIIARGTGGANAGHTVVIDGNERIFHLIPAGIAYDKEGKINVLGNGMVIHVPTLLQEMAELRAEGCTYNHLEISKDAHVVLPFHIAQDQARDKSQAKGGIGSTGRGIGPCYTDKVARRGVMMRDLYDSDVLAKKLRKLQEFYPAHKLDLDAMMTELRQGAKELNTFVCDTVALMHERIKNGSKICIEGAQGVLLSIEHGTYPYLTSSDCSVNGTASGVGISAGAIDTTFGIVKFPYMTRVGGGPFPTELGGAASEEYCADVKHNNVFELEEAGVPYEIGPNGKPKYDIDHPRILDLMNSSDAMQQGMGIRLRGKEYGATTGRARRTGWVDAVAGSYAVGVNRPVQLILTKPDVMTGMDEFKICVSYADRDKATRAFTRDPNALRQMRAEYATYKGWSTPVAGEHIYGRLPKSLRHAIDVFEDVVDAHVAIVSTGPDQKDTIVR